MSFICGISFAQNQNQSCNNTNPFWSQVPFGSDLDLKITNDGFNASISPSTIYQFNNEFSTGLNLTFIYAKYQEDKRIAYDSSILSLYNTVHFFTIIGGI